MSALKAFAIVISVGLAVYLAQVPSRGSSGEDGPSSGPADTRPDGRSARSRHLAGAPFHGMAMQVSHKDGLETYKKLADEIAELGADTILISTAAYQENSSSGAIMIDWERTLSEENWNKLLQHVRQRGLRIVLMPIVLLANPRTSTEWRGVIQPPRWDEWWASYRRYLLNFAHIANRNQVEIFIIGSELISTENQPEMWDSLIAEIRKYYSGKISYSSNWDHYEKVPLWDKMDLVCMTTYHKLSDQVNPPQEHLNRAWKPIQREILAWQKKVRKPILFTEVGWPSQEGCSIEPWNYYRQDVGTRIGLEEQAKCYRSFIDAWDDEIQRSDQIIGVLWWEWTPWGGGPKCNNYTPKGKPAEKVLHDWFEGVKTTRARRNGTIAATSQPAQALP